MGELIKYKDENVIIGTLHNLYFTSYQKYDKALKEGHLSFNGDGMPEEYAEPDSGFWFRFPFPDEDKLPFGEIGNFYHRRGVPVKIVPVEDRKQAKEWRLLAGRKMQLEITQQELIHREQDEKLCLALIVRNPESDLSFRIEEDPAIRKIIKDILRNHVVKATDAEERTFYRKIASRIRDGFRLEVSAKNTRQQSAGKARHIRRRGRGLR